MTWSSEKKPAPSTNRGSRIAEFRVASEFPELQGCVRSCRDICADVAIFLNESRGNDLSSHLEDVRGCSDQKVRYVIGREDRLPYQFGYVAMEAAVRR